MKVNKEIWDICKNCVFADTDCPSGMYCSEEYFKNKQNKKDKQIKAKKEEVY